MVTIASHALRMSDRAAQDKKISVEFAGRRAGHLAKLHGLEEMVRELAPLPISYDVSRIQPPYFNEFTYTELMGCLYLAPQSCELAARIVDSASQNRTEGAFDPAEEILARAGMDKYELETVEGELPARVAFVPGSNCFLRAVCRETLTRAMHDDPALMIKPHPMTGEDVLRTLGQLYGYHRILDPKASGWAYLAGADEALVTTTTELGLYAALLGKPIINLTKVSYEARGSYAAFYRPLWGKTPEAARMTLAHLIRAPASGFLHPGDPDAREKAIAFYDLAMRLREPFRPLVQEYDPAEYAAFVSGMMVRRTDA